LAANGVSDNRHTSVTSAEVDSLRGQVNDALAKRRQAYQQEHARQSGNEDKRKEFAEKANSFIQYVDSQKNALSALSGEPEDRIAGTHSIYQDGAPANSQVQQLEALDQELKGLGVYDNKHTPYSLPVVQTRKNQYDTSVQNFLAGLKEEQELNARTAKLQAEYERALKLENLRINYSSEAGALVQFLESANETLSDPIKTDSVADVQEFQRAYDAVASERSAQQAKYEEVVRLADEVASNNIQAQPAVADVTSRWNSYLADLDSRRDALAQELSRQQTNESLRVSFADKAKALRAFIHEQSAAVNSPGSGSLQDQLNVVQARRPVIAGAESQLREVEQLAHQLDAAGVYSNPHTDITYPVLKVDYEELVKVATNKETLIQKEILRQSNSNVTAEQLAEFKEVFEHFDKDRTGYLDRLQFKSSLQSIGEDYPDAELDRIIGQIGTNGKVGFEAFANFVSSKAADSDTKPQILEAFSTLAGGKEFVTEDDLRRALPAEKVDYLIKNIPLYKGQAGSYDYTAWASKAFS
jgi:Ca2+-binding EF-hand superfamily protein